MKERLLVVEQLDEQVLPLKSTIPARPRVGWVRTLRKALGLTVTQLAKRLGVVSSRIVKIESAEIEGAITIQTMNSVAKAMNCRFVYAFVPHDSFTNEIQSRVDKLATEQLSRVAKTMQLEDQAVTEKKLKKHHEELRNTILSRAWKYLWEK